MSHVPQTFTELYRNKLKVLSNITTQDSRQAQKEDNGYIARSWN